MTEPRKDLTAELRARDKSRANDAKADLRFTKYFEYERDAKAQAKDLAERHGVKATVKSKGNQFEVVVSDGAQDEKSTREMTAKEIQAEIKAGGGREFQFPGGAVRWKALQDALHEKQARGEDEITKQAKDAATWRSPKIAGDAGTWFGTKTEAFAEAKKRREAGEDVKVVEHKYTNPRTGHTDTHYTVEKR